MYWWNFRGGLGEKCLAAGSRFCTTPTAMKSPELPITERKGSFYLRKTFGGKQREVVLATNLKTAESRAIRFLATAETSGFDTALEELRGKPVIKAGANPTWAEMEILYREFCAQSPESPRPNTIKLNLGRLKFIMDKLDVKRVGKIDQYSLPLKWFGKGTIVTPPQKRTFASAVSAASGVFTIDALAYYKRRSIPLENPFKGMVLVRPKVAQYVPMAHTIREKIHSDCLSELAPNEAMVVLMGLSIGMRRSEIAAAIPDWFSQQKDRVFVHIRQEAHFEPKAGEDGVVPIPIDLYEVLLKLRGNSDSSFFVPTNSKAKGGGRIRQQTENTNKWLKEKGLKNSRPLHALRKECGSLVAKQSGILAASKILRNTPQVCAIHYAGIAEQSPVDMAASFKEPKDPLQDKADSLGITLDELLKRLAQID